MYALNENHEIIFATSGEICDDIVPGSVRDIKIRYFLKFKKEVENTKQWRSAVIENGNKQPQYLGVTFDEGKQLFVSSDGKECHDPTLLSSYVKILVRQRGLLLKYHFDAGFREKFANNESLKVIYDYFNATEEEKVTNNRFRLLLRRERIAQNCAFEKDNHRLYRSKPTQHLNGYQILVKSMHDGLPPLFERQGKEYYAETVAQSCNVEGDPRKIKLPLTGSTKFYTIYFPPVAKQRHLDIIKTSLCLHSFPSSINKEIMRKNMVSSIVDEIMWDEGKLLAQLYVRKRFDELHLSIAAIIAMCCRFKDGKFETLSPYALQPTTQLSWRGVRYNKTKELYADIVISENWKTYQDKEFVPFAAKTVRSYKKLSEIEEIPIPDVRSKILAVNEDRYLLSLEDGEEFPLEELDLINNIPNVSLTEQQRHFFKGKQEGKIILTKLGMEFALKKYRIPEWQM